MHVSGLRGVRQQSSAGLCLDQRTPLSLCLALMCFLIITWEWTIALVARRNKNLMWLHTGHLPQSEDASGSLLNVDVLPHNVRVNNLIAVITWRRKNNLMWLPKILLQLEDSRGDLICPFVWGVLTNNWIWLIEFINKHAKHGRCNRLDKLWAKQIVLAKRLFLGGGGKIVYEESKGI